MKLLRYYITFLCLLFISVMTLGQFDSVNNQKKAKQVKGLPQNIKPKRKAIILPDEKKGLVISEPVSEKVADSFQKYKSEIQQLKKKINESEENNKKKISKLEEENENLSNQIERQKEPIAKKGFSFYVATKKIMLTTLIILFVLAIIILIVKNKKWEKGKVRTSSVSQNSISESTPYMETAVRNHKNKIFQNTNKFNVITPSPVNSKYVTSPFSNILVESYIKDPDKNRWFVVGASAIGNSHIASKKPCQDNHHSEYFGNGWGIAITSDGAGSADFSHYGSEFVAKTSALNAFKNLVLKNKWHKKNYLPNNNEWQTHSLDLLRQVYKDLEIFARKNNYPFASVACTVIVVIFSPNGLLVTHIGDGRAGYRNENNEWKSMLTPHKGEESNQTIFITSTPWVKDKNLKMSDVLVPESRVISENPKAFILMSDGCEAHSFECSTMDFETNKWSDPNRPYAKFFDPVYDQLTEMRSRNVALKDANEKWKQFIVEGTSGLKEESDDKTMIVGILI
jgi:serine/threonine protein phosphatase PrpC